MADPQIDRLRTIVRDMLSARGDNAPFNDSESLFLGGRLDSMAATQLIVALEDEFGVEIGGADFDVSALDSVEEMATLLV